MKNDTAVSLLVASLVIALMCVPVMAANVTYSQEYYTLESSVDEHLHEMDIAFGYGGNIVGGIHAVVSELRRQTILMEKQNELLAEQNELMGMLVNATEIKFECKATGYVQQATSWSDYPEVDASDYYYNINPADVVTCENATISERFEYGCHS
jgi:hypothetical protein